MTAIIKCPTAYAAASTAVISEADRIALRIYHDLQDALLAGDNKPLFQGFRKKKNVNKLQTAS